MVVDGDWLRWVVAMVEPFAKLVMRERKRRERRWGWRWLRRGVGW